MADDRGFLYYLWGKFFAAWWVFFPRIFLGVREDLYRLPELFYLLFLHFQIFHDFLEEQIERYPVFWRHRLISKIPAS